MTQASFVFSGRTMAALCRILDQRMNWQVDVNGNFFSIIIIFFNSVIIWYRSLRSVPFFNIFLLWKFPASEMGKWGFLIFFDVIVLEESYPSVVVCRQHSWVRAPFPSAA